MAKKKKKINVGEIVTKAISGTTGAAIPLVLGNTVLKNSNTIIKNGVPVVAGLALTLLMPKSQIATSAGLGMIAGGALLGLQSLPFFSGDAVGSLLGEFVQERQSVLEKDKLSGFSGNAIQGMTRNSIQGVRNRRDTAYSATNPRRNEIDAIQGLMSDDYVSGLMD